MLEKDAFVLFALVEQALGDACVHAALFADASEDARQIGERRLFPGSSEGSPWYRDRPCIRSPSPFPSQEQAAMKRSCSQMVPAQDGAAIATPRSTTLRDFDDTDHPAPLSGPDQPVARDPPRMKRSLHSAQPVSPAVEKTRKSRRDTLILTAQNQ